MTIFSASSSCPVTEHFGHDTFVLPEHIEQLAMLLLLLVAKLK